MKGNDIRENYLSFFENKKDHLRLKSFSLIPKDDPSLLLIGAGMAPLKPYFTGKVEPPKHRVTTSQKCIRTGDIENVGSDFLGMGISDRSPEARSVPPLRHHLSR